MRDDNVMRVSLHQEQMDMAHSCISFVVSGKRKSPRVMRVKAMGGTGKTHTMRNVVRFLKSKIRGDSFNGAVVSFTGRAASQLSKDGISATTTHALLYTPVMDEHGDLVSWDRNSTDEIRQEYDYIVVDESSMLPSGILKDILSIGLPVILTGDSEQLDSVDSEIKDFNVMSGEYDQYEFITHPDVTLEVNRRIDEDCMGITKMTLHCRKNNSIPRIGGKGLKYVLKKKVFSEAFHRENQYDAIICGTHSTRRDITDLVRNARGFYDSRPEVGEVLMNLVNTVIGKSQVYNGDLFTVVGRIDGIDEATYFLKSEDGKKELTVPIYDSTFTQETRPSKAKEGQRQYGYFTFGYVMTCHKAQGSTFNSVLFVDEDTSYFLNQKKFRYTAVSRAAKLLTVTM